MKKNKALRIAAALLVVVMLTTCGMTGALAKYVDTVEVGSTTVRAGLWRIGGPGASTHTFETFLLEGDATADTDTETHATPYVTTYPTATNDGIVVPGSIIKVKAIEVTNYSEVDVALSFGSITVTGLPAGANLYWKKDITDTSESWKDLSATPPTASLLGVQTLKAYMNYTTTPGDLSTASLSGFYILWPYSMAGATNVGYSGDSMTPITTATGVGLDGQAGNTDEFDTAIGKVQANAMLNSNNVFTVDTNADVGTIESGKNAIRVNVTVLATQID